MMDRMSKFLCNVQQNIYFYHTLLFIIIII